VTPDTTLPANSQRVPPVANEHAPPVIAVDPDFESDPESIGGKTTRSTKSLTESLYEIIEENGREYCNETYFMPNDEGEQARLSIVNQIYLRAMKSHLYRAPISKEISRVLDVGAGTCDWAIAMGLQFPKCQVIAMDIGVFDPEYLPQNVSFEIDDAEEEWTFTEPFDFVHMRNLAGAFSSWKAVYSQAFRHLAPGGYIEIKDFDYTEVAGLVNSDYLHIYALAIQSAAELSTHPRTLAHLEPATLTSVGFTDVTTYVLNVPVGTWRGDRGTLGKMCLVALLEGLEAHSLRLLTKYKGWTAEEVRDLCDKVKAELSSWKTGSFFPVHIVVARKPTDASDEL